MSSAPQKKSLASGRSKAGCWTCRSRKVKCDEGKPTCGPCTRLKLRCDGYGPRITFRDDTKRIINRMTNVNTTGNPVFDANSKAVHTSIKREYSSEGNLYDIHRAETDDYRSVNSHYSGIAGYSDIKFKVLSPESFERAYREDSLDSLNFTDDEDEDYDKSSASTLQQQEHQQQQQSKPLNLKRKLSISLSPSSSASMVAPNIYYNDYPLVRSQEYDINSTADFTQDGMLRTDRRIYELSDDNDKSLSASQDDSIALSHLMANDNMIDSTHMALNDVIPLSPTTRDNTARIERELLPPISPPGVISSDDRKFLHHYLYVVAPRLSVVDRGPRNPFRSQVVAQAVNSPALVHAILAVSAYNIRSPADNLVPIEAIVHYQKSLGIIASQLNDPSNANNEGLFLAATLLCLYEIGAADNFRWQDHIRGLREIMKQRIKNNQPLDSVAFLSWLLACMDTQAVIGGGNGEFVGFVLENRILPEIGSGIIKRRMEYTPIERQEVEVITPMFSLHQKCTILLFKTVRINSAYQKVLQNNGLQNFHEANLMAQGEHIIQELDGLWRQRPPIIDKIGMDAGISRPHFMGLLPSYQLVVSFHRACVIYFHRVYKLNFPVTQKIISAIQDILQILRDTEMRQTYSSRRFLIMPAFMAGVETTDKMEQTYILDFMTQMQRHQLGRNWARAREALMIQISRQEQTGLWTRLPLEKALSEVGVVLF